MLDAHPAPAAPARAPATVPAPSIAKPSAPQSTSTSAALLAAARTLLPVLEAGRALDAPHVARGDDAGFRRLRRGRRLALEGRLRGGRGGIGAVPPALRPPHAARGRRRSGRPRRHVAHAGDPGGAGAFPDAALGGAAQVSAVLDAAASGLRGAASGHDPPRRRGARTLGGHRDVGRHGAACPRQGHRRAAPQRDRRRPRRPPRRTVSEEHGHPPQRGVDP